MSVQSFDHLPRRWLCVAYAFPPILRSGTHRTLGFVRSLSQEGWDATVLTVAPRGEPLDTGLLTRVPDTTRILRTRWFDPIAGIKRMNPRGWFGGASKPSGGGEPGSIFAPSRTRRTGLVEWLTTWLHVPDSRIGWILPGVIEGLRAVRRDRPRVLYSTSPYPSAHLIALVLRELTRLPWVADFRDPWRGNPFASVPHGSADCWDAWLETAVLLRASCIVCNSPTMTRALQNRSPRVADKCTTILNGFDRERYVGVRPRRVVDDGQIALVHAGQFYGPRSPMPWFRALRKALELAPERARRLRLILLGSESFEGRSLMALAAQYGVTRQVRVLGHQCHDVALSIMAGADALALAGATGAGAQLQIPNKLFECLALRRPIIAAVAETSPVRAILEAADARCIACAPADVSALANTLVTIAIEGTISWRGSWSGVDQFERAHAAEQLLHIFERVTRRRRGGSAIRASGALPRWVSPSRTTQIVEVADERFDTMGESALQLTSV